ncbi:MAG: cytochrome b/b6 domain-containing protein [Rhodospirillales bacterium]|nr:cytochrome b/b6 domain-containing protein [Rhodospirillales bacterium]
MTEDTKPTVKVWDPVVRVFHWSLVGAFALAWLTGDELDRVHEIAGYVILGLVAVRLVWGVIGPRYARFTQFVPGVRGFRDYLTDIGKGREHRHLGHNPAGGAMVVALLLALLATGGTGWMMTLDMFWGSEWVEEVHEVMANMMLVLVGLHVAGVAVVSIRHRENLVRAMLTGRKRPPAPGDIA